MTTIDREILLGLLRKVMPGVDTKEGVVSGTDTILITTAGFHTFNEHICVTAPMDTGLEELAVKGNDFFKLVNKLPVGDVTLEKTETHLLAKGGRTKAKLRLLSSNNLIQVETLQESIGEWLPLPEDYRGTLVRVNLKNNKASFRGVIHYGNLIASADGMRFGYHGFPGQNQEGVPAMLSPVPDEETRALVEIATCTTAEERAARNAHTWWLDSPVIDQLGTLQEPMNQFQLTDNGKFGKWVHYLGANGTIFSAMRKDSSMYPLSNAMSNFRMVQDAINATPGMVIPEGMVEAISRCAVLAGTDENGNNVVTLSFLEDGLMVDASNTNGEAEEMVPYPEEAVIDPGAVDKVIKVNAESVVEQLKAGYSVHLVQDPFLFLALKKGESATAIPGIAQ